MPIYDIFATKEQEQTAEPETEVLSSGKDRFFSSLTARVLFFLLLIGDIFWGVYALCLVLIAGPLNLLTGGRAQFLHRLLRKNWISLKRSGICGVSLFISLFSPALGIMIACTYFMMYDKKGIQEVVPRSLQDQFQEFLK
ncbi:MAG TPA: hypothetical protein VMR37_04330 [Rhabdochlamydiaceae bacterium]|jgi:hypothetical protein|nr:hypothetical protein [Rhabdochlamydiaceae bacterium]